MTVLLISVGAFVGAPARYLTDRGLQRRFGSAWPWGTLTVNVAASLILGGLLGAGDHLDARIVALAGTGFCGALSTYSTFSFETLRLHQDGRPRRALCYATASIALGLAAAALGWTIGSALR